MCKTLLFAAAAALLLFAAIPAAEAQQKKVVCYFSSWAVYRGGDGKFEAANIDPFLCTHLIYAFVGVNPDATVKILDSWNDINLGGFKKFNDLRLRNPALRTLVAIGGWNEGSTGFSNVCRDNNLRARFVNNLFDFVRAHGFNGLDLDWEYPAQRGGASTDKTNFATLVRELRAKFAPAGLLLSAAVGAGIYAADVGYDVPQLSANLDFINLMTYDYHASWEGRTGQNSPMTAASIDSDKFLNIQSTVNYWVQRGADRSKLVLGVPMYGRSFTLTQTTNNGLGAPTSGAGAAGQFSQEAGFLMYSEICRQQREQAGWTVRWNSEQQVPYAFRSNQWVGYDHVDSVRVKANYAKQQGLGGVMVYALEMDDFRNVCAGGQYPLVSALKGTFLA